MKKIIRFFFLTALTVGILNFAQAQRGRDSRGSGGGNGERASGSASPSRSFSPPARTMTQRSAPVRTFDRNRSNNTNYNNNAMRNPVRGGNNARITPQRNTTVYNTRNTVVARNGYSGAASRGYNNSHIYSRNYRYQSYYGNVYGRRTGFMYGPRYSFIPHSFISIRFGGYPYYYNNGFFYGYYGGYYQPIFPPFGLQIGVLPYGYSSFYWGGYPYYYYNGIYYRNYGDDGYQVVDAPMGATVSSLPGGATSVVVNGEVLYELNGTYYKAEQDANGNNVFTVVGKNGVINNTPSVQNQTTQPPSTNMQYPQDMESPSSDNAQPAAPSQMNPAATTPSSSKLNVGDTVSQLPDGSRLITINGEQLYETPDNVYMKGELNNGVVQFKVVGK